MANGLLAQSVLRTHEVAGCPRCESEGVIAVTEITDRSRFVPGVWKLRECKPCALVWLDPQPDSEDLGLCYPGDYYAHTAPVGSFSLGSSALMRSLRGMILSGRLGYRHLCPDFPFANTLGLLLSPFLLNRAAWGNSAMLPAHRGGGNLLEIGCGNGQQLVYLQGSGWNVFGIEPHPGAAKQAADRLNARVWASRMEDVDPGPERFDVIVSSHAIEHTYDPAFFVRRAGEWLRPGGRLIVLTPNYQSLGRRLLKKDWFALDPPRHLVLLTPHSIRQACEDTGLFSKVSVTSLARNSYQSIHRFGAFRQSGSFNKKPKMTIGLSAATALFGLCEWLGSASFRLGDELLLVATRK